MPSEKINPISHVIHNPVAEHFVNSNYSLEKSKGDFVTLRPLNRSEFRMDLLCKIAKDNPLFKFDIYGKGDYFQHHEKPQNVNVISDFLLQPDIPKILNQYKYGLMLSHHDSQGVMACEIASYGMKLITSATPAAQEMFQGFENVKLISNTEKIDMNKLVQSWDTPPKNSSKFSMQNTAEKELQLIENAAKEIRFETKQPAIR